MTDKIDRFKARLAASNAGGVFEPPTLQHVKLIGLGHRARQGKDSVARALITAYPGRVYKVAFADALRAVARVYHGMTTKDAPLLQRIGVSARDRDPHVWVRAAAWVIAEIDAEVTTPTIVVVTDVRFPNEFEMIRQMGGICVRVEREMPDGAVFVPTDRDPNHESEIALADAPWPFSIRVRDGEMFRLRDDAIALAQALGFGG